VMTATRTVFAELGEEPHLPFLPELPARGPGADMIGRSAVMLVDLPVDLQPSGWRLVDHPGRDHSRARGFRRQDLDVLAEVAEDYSGLLKLQVTGPWTLASQLWLPRLERVVVDAGAVRDLIGSLAEGVVQHLGEVASLVPGARLVLQVDEPGLGAVLEGSLPTASGFGRLRAVDEAVVVDGLRDVLDAARAAGAVTTVIHSCAAGVPVAALARTGADALSLDVAQLRTPGWEQVAEMIEAGTALWAGAVPTSPAVLGGALPRPDAVADAVWKPWKTLGLEVAAAAAVVVTPACGLAGARSPQVAGQILRVARRGAAELAERADA
jgi:methionine synthase II (cobalamin-independent)